MRAEVENLGAPLCAPPLKEPRAPRFRLPSHACDGHLHVLGPARSFPYTPARVYTPPDCLLSDYLPVRDYLGVERCVLVQPSVYANDNRVLLQALRKLGDSARGVVALRGDESRQELDEMHALGVRGVRVNLVDVREPAPGLPVERLQRLAQFVGPLGWHLELLVHVDRYPGLQAALGDLGVQVVFGHMGYLSREVKDIHDPSLQAMYELMKSGKAWAKVSGAYRVADPPDYAKAAAIVRWLVDECPQRLVWGTDWPHVRVKSAMPHDSDLLDAIAGWVPQRAHQEALFATNAAGLYGWP
jgi:2-pyrone-4,6-dicarboxylate lactonase